MAQKKVRKENVEVLFIRNVPTEDAKKLREYASKKRLTMAGVLLEMGHASKIL